MILDKLKSTVETEAFSISSVASLSYICEQSILILLYFRDKATFSWMEQKISNLVTVSFIKKLICHINVNLSEVGKIKNFCLLTMFSVIAKFSAKVSQRRFLKADVTISLRFQSTENTEKKIYELYLLEDGPQEKTELDSKDALLYLRQMQIMRKMENISPSLYMEKLIRGFLHLYVGQEACATGIKQAMDPNDTVITSYRCHGWAYIMGETPRAVLAELMGKSTGKSTYYWWINQFNYFLS